MRPSGWIFIIFSWAAIISLAIFCFTMVFKKGLGGKKARKE
ncbi:MAG: hypothetical protein V1883_02985 [Candidatus Omnitrophota bacterium]